MKKNNFNSKNTLSTIWIYGRHPIIAALKNSSRKIHRLVVSNPNILNDFQDISLDVKVEVKTNEYIKSILPNSAVQQNAALEVSPIIQPKLENFLSTNPSCLMILDQITDPHNVGAIIRSAAAFSVDALITTHDNSPDENATLIKSSSGTYEILPYIRVTNLRNTIQLLKQKEYWCIGLDSNTNQYINSISLPEKVAFIMGSEDKGMRTLTKTLCDLLVKLPISSNVDSLNVSNAAAIILYEYRKLYKL